MGREKGTNNSKYTRAYLNLVKAGDVFSKSKVFGSMKATPKMYSPLTEAKVYERKKSNERDDEKKIIGTKKNNMKRLIIDLFRLIFFPPLLSSRPSPRQLPGWDWESS